jgi:hypothetical protein
MPTEIAEAAAYEREAYETAEAAGARDLHGTKRNALSKRAVELFAKALEIQFREEYGEHLENGMSSEQAFEKMLDKFTDLGKYGRERNVYELGSAYREVTQAMKTRRELGIAQAAYLAGTASSEQRASLERIRRAIFRGFRGGRITPDILREMGIPERELPLVDTMFRLAKDIGVSTSHNESDSFGSVEKFGTDSPIGRRRDQHPPQFREDKD